MKHTSASKTLTACILTVSIILPFVSASLLRTTDAKASSLVSGAIGQQTSAPPQFRKVLRTFAPFWRIGNGYSSALIVRNTAKTSSAGATPIIFTPDKKQVRLPAIQLAPGEVKRIYLEEALPIAGSAAESGALALQIDQSQSPTVIGEVVITNYQEGIIFDIPLHAGYAGSQAKTLHAAWWLPDEKTEGTVVLFNASEQAIVVHPSITINSSQRSFADVTLAAHESKKLDLRDLIQQHDEREAQVGSITLSYDGPPQALLPALLLSNAKNGFSLTGKFFPKQSQQPNQASTVNWYYPIVLTGKPDPAFGFKKGAQFTPYVLVSNPTSSVITPQLTASFTGEGEAPQTVNLPVSPLPPFKTRLIDLSELTEELMPENVSAFSLQLRHQGASGDLAVHVFSVDHKKDFVFTSEGTMQLTSRLDSIYWNIADDLQSMLVVQNAGNSPIHAQATLVYDTSDGQQGKYTLPPLEVPARGTRMLNLKQIITSGQPDATGQVIPPGTTFGTMTIEPVAGEQSDALVGGSVTFDPDAGECGGGLFPLCSPNQNPGFGFTIILDGIELPPCDLFLLIPVIAVVVCDFLCDPRPSVVISGPDSVPLAGTSGILTPAPIDSIQLIGTGDPPGGTFNWSTSSPHVTLSNTSSDTVTVKSASESGAPNDVAIVLVYAVNGQGNSATKLITVQKPTSMAFIDIFQEGSRTCANDPATGLPEAGWTKVITWQLQDKWNQPIASVPSYDTLTGGSPNSCLLSVFEGTPPGGAVGITGLWRHEYGICSTACANGGTCTTNGSWNFFANGWEIDLPFTFQCNSITVGGH